MGLARREAEIAEQLAARGSPLPAAAARRSSAAGSDFPAPRIPAADDGTGRRSRSALRRSAVRSSSRHRRGRLAARRSTSPASGRSSSPARCSSVDLPAPEGAISATDWPGQSARLGAAQHFDGRFAAPVAALDLIEPSAGQRPALIHSEAPRPDRAAPPATRDRSSRRATGPAPSRRRRAHRSARPAKAVATGNRTRTGRGSRR